MICCNLILPAILLAQSVATPTPTRTQEKPECKTLTCSSIELPSGFGALEAFGSVTGTYISDRQINAAFHPNLTVVSGGGAVLLSVAPDGKITIYAALLKAIADGTVKLALPESK